MSAALAVLYFDSLTERTRKGGMNMLHHEALHS